MTVIFIVHIFCVQIEANVLTVSSLLNVSGYFDVQKVDLSAEFQKKYPHYGLYLYGEGYVTISYSLYYIYVSN